MKRLLFATAAVAALGAAGTVWIPGAGNDYRGWPAYGGGPEQIRYSRLAQITRANVRRLEVAWTYDTGEQGGLQSNPIVVDNVLYTTTPRHKVVALDAATGALRWTFTSGIEGRGPNRGVTYWAAGGDRRVFTAQGSYVYAVNARTGQPIPAFGRDGRIDLREDLGRDASSQFIALTTPAVIYEDLLIVGGRVGEGLPASPGHVRAYDARTGALRWTFHTIPHPGEVGHDTWPADAWTYSGGANNWAGMAIDEGRGAVYVPTGSASADFYGANRTGDNLFANSVLALDASTGKRLWHFQYVRHDLWDRDFPAPPSLVTVTRRGRRVDAVAQTTKDGHVLVLDRSNGQPVFPLEERTVPPSTIEGERAADTQRVPTKPAPFARQRLTEEMLTTRTPEARAAALAAFRTFRNDGQFVPFSVGAQTVVFPGFDGGAEWGGSAFDPETGLLYVNSNEMAWTGGLVPDDGKSPGAVGLKYRFTGYRRFLDPDGYPAIAPPWGTLNAINLNTGEPAWTVPLGEYPELAQQGVRDTGSENYGGPVVTAGGLVFIGATNFDRKVRAFDKATGKLLWDATLPFSANGTPSTYEAGGRQFVVVPAGRGRAAAEPGGVAPSGGVYTAFALRR